MGESNPTSEEDRMTRGSLIVLAAITWTACTEEPGTPVVLNERLFVLPSLASAGKGCTTFHLTKHNPNGLQMTGSGSGNIPGLIVSQRSGGPFVLIQVTEDDRVVAERRYDEAFFRAGKLDEFAVRGTSGEEKLLRYWGTVADDTGRCTSFDDDGDRFR